jgi:hypothetical protein
MLARGAAAEIPARHDHIPGSDFTDERRVRILHAVGSQKRRVRRVDVPRRDDQIGIDVIAEFPDSSPEFHDHCLLCFLIPDAFVKSSAGKARKS